MSDALQLQAKAARLVRRRRLIMAGITCALRDVQAMDHQLAQMEPGLTPHARLQIAAERDTQDTRLAVTLTPSALTTPGTISTPPNKEAKHDQA